MFERVSRFDATPGKVPPPYPSKPVQTMARWLVRLLVEGNTWPTKVDTRVWAYSSTDAVERARAEFYGSWATQADREHLPVRVLEVLQVAV